MNKDEKQEFSFVRETVKTKPVNKQKLFRRTVITAFSALVFGLIACFTFLVLEPVISNWLYPEEITKVQFPEADDEKRPDEMLSEGNLQEDLLEELQKNIETNIMKQLGNSTEGYEELTIESHQELYNQLYTLSKEASDFMVTVKGAVSQKDWFREVIEIENSTSGVIVKDNGVGYLVLASTRDIQDAESFRVRFNNGKLADAYLKASDSTTGLGVFEVKYDIFTETEKEEIEIAELGNSKSSSMVGRPILAIGSPTGQSGSVAYGIVTANQGTLNLVDGVYRILDTDMSGTEDSHGVIINTKKEVVGIITRDSMDHGNKNVISAMGIAEIKFLIGKLSNNEPLTYGGIIGMDITKEVHEELGVPYGAYVTDVVMHSPAMEAGLLNGDIIVNIDLVSNINIFNDYRNIIFDKKQDEVVRLSIMRNNGSEYIPYELEMVLKAAQ